MSVRCQIDNDDEVRDRATYFRAILDKQEAALNSMYILNGMQVGTSSTKLICINFFGFSWNYFAT